MSELEEVIQASAEEYTAGMHCSEVIFKNITRAWRPDFDESLVRIATPFGSGIADRGDVCGALIGGLMVIGYLFGRRSLDESQDLCWQLSQKFYDRFQETFRYTTCHEIKDRIPDWDECIKCSPTVKQSVSILWEILDSAEKTGKRPAQTT